MWPSLTAAHLFRAPRAARAIVAAIIAAFAFMMPAPSHAAPVEYVKICSLYGAGFFYLPGTDTCVFAPQITANQFDIARAATLSATGTAMAASLVAPWLPTGTNYAVSTHWAGFNGQNAVGVSGLMRVSGHFVLSVGFAAGLDNGSLYSVAQRTQTEFSTSVQQQSWSEVRGLSRAGFMYAW